MTRSAPNFDRVAHIYRWAEYICLGPLLQRTRTALLNRLAAPQHALVVGDGDGRFLEQLLRVYPDCSALAVDTSNLMLSKLRRRCDFAGTRLTTIQRSVLDLDPPPDTDLIVTHFLLDCFHQSDVDSLVHRLASSLPEGGHWLVSDFALPEKLVLRPLARAYIRSLYAAFGLLTGLSVRELPDPQTALLRAGLQCVARRTFAGGLLYTELWRRE